MPRPQPESFPNWWTYHQAKKGWTRSTGGSLLGTFLLCLVIGLISGSGAMLLVLVVGGLGLHLALRSGWGRDMALEGELDRLEHEVLRSRRGGADGTALTSAEAILRESRPGSRVFR